jgi:transcriptional regulator with XRE-family HTH domain
MSKLSELIVAANSAGLSARAMSRRALAEGHALNHDTAARYLRGDHGTPDETTLLAFSSVLGISMRDLRAAADLPSETTAPYAPPPEASRLTRRQRRAVDEIIRAMLEPGRAREVTELTSRRSTTSGRRAARHGDPEPPSA